MTTKKKTVTNKKAAGGPKGRPKPSSPRAGFKVNGSRYGCGGKLNK